jgi:hypothetical protein
MLRLGLLGPVLLLKLLVMAMVMAHAGVTV